MRMTGLPGRCRSRFVLLIAVCALVCAGELGVTDASPCTCTATADPVRTLSMLRELRRFGAAADHPLGVIRPALSEEDIAAREWVSEVLQNNGSCTTAKLDGVGNLLAHCEGGQARGPRLLMGSHSDTQPTGGWLDGALGVVYAVEAAVAMQEAGCSGRWSVADWSDEEGRFGAMTGSSEFSGVSRTTRPDGLARAREERGLTDVPLLRWTDAGSGPWLAYLEAHIEQGSKLYDSGQHIGVVEAIVGLRQRDVRFVGQANHAGATPMDKRKDAAMAAYRYAVELRDIYFNNGTDAAQRKRNTVWNMGRIKLTPNMPAVVAATAELTVQFRDVDEGHLQWMDAELLRLAARHNGTEGVDVYVGPDSYGVPAAIMDSNMVSILEEVAERRHPQGWRKMNSHGIHDASAIATVMPTALMFVPSIDGISHNFDENTSDEDIAKGVSAYVEVAARLVSDACDRENDGNREL